MAVERIEWQCPSCQRKFAIPSNQPRPKLCPHCQQTATSIPTRRPSNPSSPAPTFPSPQAIEPSFDPGEELFDTLEDIGDPALDTSRPTGRRRYEILRTISSWFKVLAIVVAALHALAFIGFGILIIQSPPDLRVELFVAAVLAMVYGVTLVLLLYAFAVLLLVAMDIEHNTHRD